MTQTRPSREEIQSEFVRLFENVENARRRARELELADAEGKLQTILPTAYRQFIERYGSGRSFSLGSLTILSAGSRFPDISRFFGPRELVSVNAGHWMTPIFSHITGLETDAEVDVFRYLVAFTTDAGGSFVCFPRCALPNDDLPVFFFDHDLGGVHQIAPSFDDFLWSCVKQVGLAQHTDHQHSAVEPFVAREELTFTAENDHNPSCTEECE